MNSSGNTLVQEEPVLVAHGVAAVLGFVFSLLVTHGVITGTQSSALTQEITPFVVAIAIALLGVIVRHFVTPAAKALGFTDADMARVAALIEAAGYFQKSQVAEAQANANQPPALPPGSSEAPQSMAAGVPAEEIPPVPPTSGYSGPVPPVTS